MATNVNKDSEICVIDIGTHPPTFKVSELLDGWRDLGLARIPLKADPLELVHEAASRVVRERDDGERTIAETRKNLGAVSTELVSEAAKRVVAERDELQNVLSNVREERAAIAKAAEALLFAVERMAGTLEVSTTEAPPVVPNGFMVQLDDDGTIREWSLWMPRGLDRVEIARSYNPPEIRAMGFDCIDITEDGLRALNCLMWAIKHNKRPPHASDPKHYGRER